MQIKTVNFNKESNRLLKGMPFTEDWPVVYVLENRESRELYVGESVSVRIRLKRHYDRHERRRLNKAHIIIDEEFNKSATLDTESWLIQFFAADGIYKLQNSNGGLSNHSYFDREKYEAKFNYVWSKLQELGMANQDLVQLRNSDIFKYSPYKSLTNEQVLIVKDIHEKLKGDTHGTYIVNGEAGTGKSVLGTFLVKYLLSDEDTKDIKVALVVPMTNLRATLKKVFRSVKGLSSSMVIGPNEATKNRFDLLIVDEAHRLKRRINLTNFKSYDDTNKKLGLRKDATQLDWIMRSSRSQILLYDPTQSVIPGDIRKTSIMALHAHRYQLTSQLRVLAENDYIRHIENLLSLRVEIKKDFGNYDLRYFDNVREMINEIKLKDRKKGLSRVVAGYAWDWKTKKGGDYDIELDGLKLTWNGTNIDWVNSKNAINEVGCIHTIQGYDLNYVGVIIGPELCYNPKKSELYIDKQNYKDFNGKRGIENPEELKEYILNIYKTLLTRGIYGTYVHAVDKNLNDYLREKL